MAVAAAAPWSSYATGTEADHFSAFCEEFLIQFVDRWAGKPLSLEGFQDEFFGEALAYGDDGYPYWNSIVLVVPRKNAKTTSLAALGAYRLFTATDYPEILLAAASDKQAGRLFDNAATFIRQNQELEELVRLRDYIGEIVREDGLGKMIRLTNAAGTIHGYNPSLVICDELHAWVTPLLQRAWAALTTGDAARTSPQTFTITTAGESRYRHEPILGALLDAAETQGEVETRPGLKIIRVHESKTLLYVYEAPLDEKGVERALKRQLTDGDLEKIKQANPASWITIEYLRKKSLDPFIQPHDFLQLHCCIWSQGASAWLPAGRWDELAAPREVPLEEEICVGFDGSYNNDSTALVGCTRDGYVFVLGVWERPEGVKEWKVPRDEVEARVQEVMDSRRVVNLICDPPGWHAEIERWTERWGDMVVLDFPTYSRTRMSPACSKFFTAVVEGSVSHDGNRRLSQHLANAVVKETSDGAYISKDGRNSPRKIDLAVAAVIAHDRATMEAASGYLMRL